MVEIADSYRVRVRQRVYLWGGQQSTASIVEIASMFLTVRNDDSGEPVTIKTEIAAVGGGRVEKDDLGKLLRGQACTIKLNGLIGVYAVQDDGRPTFLNCTMHGI
jgi:hypothetical protein